MSHHICVELEGREGERGGLQEPAVTMTIINLVRKREKKVESNINSAVHLYILLLYGLAIKLT